MKSFTSKLVFLAVLAFAFSVPSFAQYVQPNSGHCEDRCDAPGFDIAGFITGPQGAVTGVVKAFDWNDPNVQAWANCLVTNLSGRTYSNRICPYTAFAAISEAATNGGVSKGTYSMKDYNRKGVPAGTYMIFVEDYGYDNGRQNDSSGVAPGTWHYEVVTINSDITYSFQLQP